MAKNRNNKDNFKASPLPKDDKVQEQHHEDVPQDQIVNPLDPKFFPENEIPSVCGFVSTKPEDGTIGKYVTLSSEQFNQLINVLHLNAVSSRENQSISALLYLHDTVHRANAILRDIIKDEETPDKIIQAFCGWHKYTIDDIDSRLTQDYTYYQYNLIREVTFKTFLEPQAKGLKEILDDFYHRTIEKFRKEYGVSEVNKIVNDFIKNNC